MIMKWLMGEDQQQTSNGTPPVTPGVVPAPPVTPPANAPLPPTQAQPTLPPQTPRVVFVEATEPSSTPTLPTPPVSLNPTDTIAASPLPTPPAIPSPSPAQMAEVSAPPTPDAQSLAPQTGTSPATITIDEHPTTDAGDLLSQALNSSMEAPAGTAPSSFSPTPSSIAPLQESTSPNAEKIPQPDGATEIPGPATFVVPPTALPNTPSSTPPAEVHIEVITPKEPVLEKEDAPEKEVVNADPQSPHPENHEVSSQLPETPLPEPISPEDSPDLPDVSSDIKRILQERWITLANEELSKLEKRHAEISGSLVELEREQQELMAKKLKLETEQVQVEKSKKGWEHKKGEAQTMLDKVVQEVSGL